MFSASSIHPVYKRIGETPLACLRRLFDVSRCSYTYAGRLDPMAEGLLLVLSGDRCKQSEQYRAFDKVYAYEFVVGVATDSYDCLGRIVDAKHVSESVHADVSHAVSDLTGSVTLPYPPYSSKTVNGVPLFVHARRNQLDTIVVPSISTEVFSHTLVSSDVTDTAALRGTLLEPIRHVTGDFRQDTILADWKSLASFPLQRFSAVLHASSGTYVRAVVNEISRMIGYPCVVTRIKRTQIGPWTLACVSHGQ